MRFASLLSFLLLSLSHRSSSQICSRVELNQFIAEPSTYNGVVPLRASSMTGCATDTSHPGFNCIYDRNILGDNAQVPRQPNLDSEGSNNDIGKFLVWSREAANPLISLGFSQSMTVTSLNIEFLNYPAQKFSLPNLQLYRSPAYFVTDPESSEFQRIPYDLLNNSALSQDDYAVTTVSMTFSAVSSENFLLTWNYADVYNLDFFMVSEMYFCTDSVPPASNVQIDFQTPQISNAEIVPTVEDVTSVKMLVLNCTVSSAGLYMWRWRKNNGLISNNADFHIFTADGTRTSKLQLTGLNVDDAASYTCEVQHVRSNGNTFVPRTQTLSFPVFIELPAMMIGYLDSMTVSLTCEVHGFLRSMAPPTWLDSKGELVPVESSNYSVSNYSVVSTTSSRPAALISNSSAIQGQRSIFTILRLSEEDEGNYTCMVEGNSSTVQLLVIPGSPPTTTDSQGAGGSTTGISMPNTGGSAGGLVAGVIMAVLIVIAIVVVLVIVLIYFVRSRNIKLSLPKKFSARPRSISLEPLRRLSVRQSIRRENDLQASTTESMCEDGTSKKRLTKADIEWQLPHVPYLPSYDEVTEPAIYSEVSKPEREKTPPVPPQNFDPSEEMPNGSSNIVKNHYENDGFDAQKLAEGRLASASSSPKLVKVNLENSYDLDSNPIYEPSKSDMAANESSVMYEEVPPPQRPPEPKPVVTAEETTTANGSAEAPIYAQPNFTDRKKVDNSDTSSGKNEPIYSEAIHPDLFSQGPELAKDSTLTPYAPIYAQPSQLTLKKSEAPVKVPAYKIKELRQLGVGQFGEVMLAETVGLSRRDLKLSKTENVRSIRLKVAVKKLHPQAQSQVRESFDKEINFMSKLKDDNIVRLLAVCQEEPPFIVMEYMENGDLHQFLQDFEPSTTEIDLQPNQLPVSILLYMAVQVASGMRYLASLNCVHRDLATRNCLVGQNFVIKISDFGMSRSLYESSYYRVKGRAMLPIRWMASESFYGRFSEKTDVWSYGVTMWEIFTLAKHQPYEDIDDQEVIQDAIRGLSRRLLDKPEYCPMDVYQVMLRCWEYAPSDRANFEEVFSTLASIHQSI